MDTPLQIVFDGMDSSDAVEAHVREKVAKLEQFYNHIIDGRVILKRDNRRHRKGPVYSMTIEMSVPGKKLVVSHDPGNYHRHDQHLMPLINDAFAAMSRQLEHFGQIQRGEVKAHPEPLQGRVTNLFPEQEYGFVTLTDGREIYFHKNSVVRPDFDELEKETPVRIVVAYDESPIGPQATTVEAINEMRFVDRP